MSFKNKLTIITLAILISIVTLSNVHAWVEPTTIPPGNNIFAPINSSAFGQSKIGGLILNIGNAAHGLIVKYGLVGIGTDNPEAKLDVRGETKSDSLTVRTNSNLGGNLTVSGATASTGNVSTQSSLCIKGECKSAWSEVSPPGNDTLQTVTVRGATTTQNIAAPIMYDQNNSGYYVNPDSWSNLGGLTVSDTRSSIYYDRDNTGYYVDPNNTSNLNAVYGTYFHTSLNDSWFPYPGNGYNYIRGHSFMNGVLYDENNSGYYVNPDYWSNLNGLTVNDTRSSIYYDKDNTGYYVNPDASSNMNNINAAGNLCIKGDCKSAWPAQNSFPSGMISFFDLASCPPGWSEVAGAKGRYIVGTQNAGNRGLTRGQALSDGEDRPVGQHGHDVTDPGHSHKINMTGNAGGELRPTDAYAGPDWHDDDIAKSFTGVTVNNSGSVSGTNAPYIEFLTCRKD